MFRRCAGKGLNSDSRKSLRSRSPERISRINSRFGGRPAPWERRRAQGGHEDLVGASHNSARCTFCVRCPRRVPNAIAGSVLGSVFALRHSQVPAETLKLLAKIGLPEECDGRGRCRAAVIGKVGPTGALRELPLQTSSETRQLGPRFHTRTRQIRSIRYAGARGSGGEAAPTSGERFALAF